jgi:hypothetical protein
VGQKVKEGEVLASLKSDSVTIDMITAQTTLATAQRDLQDSICLRTYGNPSIQAGFCDNKSGAVVWATPLSRRLLFLFRFVSRANIGTMP